MSTLPSSSSSPPPPSGRSGGPAPGPGAAGPVLGADGTLHAYDELHRKQLDEATGNPALAVITEMSLFAQAPPIYGGTDQVQRNILGERILGLPKEPNNDRTLSWSQQPKNG